MTWLMIVQPHELVILVVVVLLLRGSELTTRSFITRMNGKPFLASPCGAQVCQVGDSMRMNGSRRVGVRQKSGSSPGW